MLIAVSLGWQSKWCQIKNINVDVQVDRSPFISPLSLSISLNNNNSHSFSLSLQFQAYARFDRNKLNLIRRYLHSLHSLSLFVLRFHRSPYLSLIRITRNEPTQPDEIHTSALYSIYWFIRGIRIHGSNSRCCRETSKCTVSKAR